MMNEGCLVDLWSLLWISYCWPKVSSSSRLAWVSFALLTTTRHWHQWALCPSKVRVSSLRPYHHGVDWGVWHRHNGILSSACWPQDGIISDWCATRGPGHLLGAGAHVGPSQGVRGGQDIVLLRRGHGRGDFGQDHEAVPWGDDQRCPPLQPNTTPECSVILATHNLGGQFGHKALSRGYN